MKDFVQNSLAVAVLGLVAGCQDYDGYGSIASGGPPRLIVTALALSPTNGSAPLTVLFDGTTNASVLGTTIVEWSWDFDDDGAVDYTAVDSAAASYTFTSEGNYTARLEVVDSAGKLAEGTVAVDVLAPLSVSVAANPGSGVWPLTVRLGPTATSSGPSVASYRWDFDGDGSFDTGFIVEPDPQYHTYTAAGTYPATVEVTDAVGNTAQGSVAVVVTSALPTASVTLVPSDGPLPLDVTIDLAALNQNGPITSVSIDPSDRSPPIDLSGPGIAKDGDNSAVDFIQSPLVSVDVGPPAGSRTAEIRAAVTPGNAPPAVTSDASASSSPQGSIASNEGAFDDGGSNFPSGLDSGATPTVTATFDVAGTQYVAVRVTNDSNQSSVDLISVPVDLNVFLEVLDDTIDPHALALGGGGATVRTTLSAASKITVEIGDRTNLVVRTLFSGERAVGTHDLWDETGACEITLWITLFFSGAIEPIVITARTFGAGTHRAHSAGVTDDGS